MPRTKVELPAMMRLVLEHRAQPLPDRDRCVRWRPALLGETRVGELGEQRARFRVEAIVVRDRRGEAVGELAADAPGMPMADRARSPRTCSARSPRDVESCHRASSARVPRTIRDRRPRDKRDDAARAFVHAVEIVEKWSNAKTSIERSLIRVH